nr:uncharacterized mitochondrial protein AtMg00810-like [Tanacetum cinerariifolium]
MENCDTVFTPMVKQAKLKLDLVGKPVDHTVYRSMIGSLMYLTSNRPDIMFATCMCARYQANPNEHYVSSVKRIFRYLKGTINLGLWYLKDSGFDLTGYSDANHVGRHLDRKSTSGSVQFLGDKLVCWSSKKQNCVSISTAKSEYVVVSSCCAQVLRMRTQLTNYGFFFDKVPMYCDSKSAIAISCNPVQHTRTKHIDVRRYALGTAASILNMVPTNKVEKTSYEILQGKAPKLSYLRVWGCDVIVKRATPNKLETRSIKCNFELLQDLSGSDVILDEVQEPQTEQPSTSSIILRDPELAVGEVDPTNVVEVAPPENQEDNVAPDAPVLCRSDGTSSS